MLHSIPELRFRLAGEPVESVKAVVKALAEGSIAPFHKPYDGEIDPKDPYKGTTKVGNKWKAQIVTDRKITVLGTFDTKEEAAKAYREAAKGTWRENTNGGKLRQAPGFVVIETPNSVSPITSLYNDLDIAKFLGKTYQTAQEGEQVDLKVRTALDALYLLEVKALKVSDIRDLNWSALSQVGICCRPKPGDHLRVSDSKFESHV